MTNIKQYDKWMEKLINDHFNDLNNNCVQQHIDSSNKLKCLRNSEPLKGITEAPDCADAFNLNTPVPTGNFQFHDINNRIIVVRYTITNNFQTYEEFKIYMVGIILDCIKKIESKTGTTKYEYTTGEYYLTFEIPGTGKNYFRDSARGYEFRGFSSCIKYG